MGLFSFLSKPVAISPIDKRIKASLAVLPQWKMMSGSSPTPLYGKDARYINLWVNNKVKYVADNIDEWSAPHKTWQTREGDCEDFAILKFFSIDISIEKYMAVGALDDGRHHCVLLALVDKEWLVLDCMRNEMVNWNEYKKRFRPIYFFNVQGVWL